MVNHPGGLNSTERSDWQGIAVWTESKSVLERGSQYGRVDRADHPILHFHGKGWEQEFTRFALSLNDQEKFSCCAAVLDDLGSFQPWNAIPMTQMVCKLTTRWFPSLLDMPQKGLISHFQPIWSFTDSKVVGFEALARAEVDGRCVTGYQIFDAARAHNALGQLDGLARITAVKSGATSLEGDELLFVNVIPAHLDDPANDLEILWQIAENHGFCTSRLVFEFIESEVMPEPWHLAKIVDQIRKHKGRVALDDFGAAHASIHLLSELRPDIVKFDRKLLADIHGVGRKKLITDLVAYARALKAIPLAEGIETIEQMAFADDCGFELAQGWLIGKPEAVPIRSKQHLTLA